MADPLTLTTAPQERRLTPIMARQPNLAQVEPIHPLAQPLQKVLGETMRATLTPREPQVLIPSKMALQRLALAVQKQTLAARQARSLAAEPLRVGVPLQAHPIKVLEEGEQGMIPALAPILGANQDQLLAVTRVELMVIMALAV